jgi:Subtilase family
LGEIVPEQTGGDGDGLAPPIRAQVNYIEASFADQDIPIQTTVRGRGVDFMCAEGQLLVRSEYLDRVRAALQQPDDVHLIRQVVAGVVLLNLVPREVPDGQLPTVRQALEQLDSELGPGIATPNHVVTVAPEVGPCPATEPQEVYQGTESCPGVCPTGDGAGVLVYVADTGLLAGASDQFPWLTGVTGDLDPLPGPQPDGTQAIPPYTGHGTFVAGVLRTQAPQAEVYVANAFAVAGSTLESDLVQNLVAALELGVDIFHLSIATTTRSDLPLLSFEGWLALLRQYKGVVCVVAAGNDGGRRPSWPAAFSGMVSVGALGADWHGRATFSNYGGWVDVYAPGRDLVNAYATGSYTCYVPPYSGDVRKFYGMTRWSGTSFSTPLVTGMIADRMSRTGENGKEAAAALLTQARCQAIPGVGAILLPCRDNAPRCCPCSLTAPAPARCSCHQLPC